jgi:hypothetical protein
MRYILMKRAFGKKDVVRGEYWKGMLIPAFSMA